MNYLHPIKQENTCHFYGTTKISSSLRIEVVTNRPNFNCVTLPISKLISVLKMLRYALRIWNSDGNSQKNPNVKPVTIYIVFAHSWLIQFVSLQFLSLIFEAPDSPVITITIIKNVRILVS